MTRLVLLNENYSDDQQGYDQAMVDCALHFVEIDEQSYSSMYNVQKSIEATSNCTGVQVSTGLVRNNIYLSLSVAEDTSNFPSDFGYETLEEAFTQGLEIQMFNLRARVDMALFELGQALPDGEERKSVDHAIDVIEQQRRSC